MLSVKDIALLAVAGSLALSGSAAAAAGPPRPTPGPPRPIPLNSGWEIRQEGAAPAPPQPGPPDESEEGQEGGTPSRSLFPSRASQVDERWRPVNVPSVFEPAVLQAYGGSVRVYRLKFVAPRAPGFTWAVHFEQARRRTTAFLNGRKIGVSVDPYTPFEFEAKGLVPGRLNTLTVTVDSRKDPRFQEGWWNWGGITRPVTLVPRGGVNVRDLGLLSDVRCKGPARGCRVKLLVDGSLSKLPNDHLPGKRGRPGPLRPPTIRVSLRSPSGLATTKRLKPRGSSRGPRRLGHLAMGVPAPKLWSPERPQLYDARVVVSYRGRVQQVRTMKIGLRSVKVKRGLLFLNNRQIQLRGASVHEDMPPNGAALTNFDMDTIVRELKELGANVTRSHYVLSEGLLRRLDRAGIMVWNQAPVWQRDHGVNVLRIPRERARAVAQVDRTVKAARSHPSVITHSVANELSFSPDRRPGTRPFLNEASARARRLDPTLPISLDIKGRPGFAKQVSYLRFDMLGINQYFGWYPWVPDVPLLDPFLHEMHDNYPRHALVMTEFGAEGRPDMARAPTDAKGSYAFQARHIDRTLAVVEQLPFMSGAIHWTLREFEIFPGWSGGAPLGAGDNIRHHKGVLTYDGRRKPAWEVLRDHIARAPLYR